MTKKKIGAILALAVSVVCIGAVVSFAYFTDRSEVTNDFTTGSLDLKVTESLWSNTDDGKNMYPGYTTDKNPTVQNVTGMLDNNAYIMAQLEVKDPAGNPITDSHRLDLIYEMIKWDPTGNNLIEGTKYSNKTLSAYENVNPLFTTERREDAKGMWTYYYSKTLNSASEKVDGDSVTLFNKIVVPLEWSQTELDVVGDYNITVSFQGIQSATFDTVRDSMAVLDGNYDDNVHKDYEENDSNRPSANQR